MLAGVLDWLLLGTDEMTLPPSWLENKDRLAQYEAWTARENESWIVSKDTAETALERDAAHDEALRMQFWQRFESKRRPAANVANFPRKARG